MTEDLEREHQKNRFMADVGLVMTLIGLALLKFWPDDEAKLFLWSTLAIGLFLFTAGYVLCVVCRMQDKANRMREQMEDSDITKG